MEEKKYITTLEYKYDIIVYGAGDVIPSNCVLVNPTSRSKEEWSKGLSPFVLGPVELYYDRKSQNKLKSQNFENAWQYAKVYEEHAQYPIDTNANEKPPPGDKYWNWAKEGWENKTARRFPMGNGAKPMYSYWDGKQLGYIEARLKIYAPLYSAAVEKTKAWGKLKKIFEKTKAEGKVLGLFDFDGHNSLEFFEGNFEKIVYNEKMKMGHAFVLAMMLLGEKVWEKEFDPKKIHSTKVPKRRIISKTGIKITFEKTDIKKKSTEDKERELQNFFSGYKVESVSIPKNSNGRFGLVNFLTHEEQIRALNTFDVSVLGGGKIKPAYEKWP